MSERNNDLPLERLDAFPYHYQSLNLNTLEIRLLELSPATSWTDDLCGSLVIVNLLDRPVYEALSYTWDGGLTTGYIKFSNMIHRIAPNLDSFLRHRRSETEAISLWVDAVCINQSSHPEKSSQVRMMNTVYAAARKLIIWLGPEGDNSSLAMEKLLLYGAGSPYDKMPILTDSVSMAFEKFFTRRWWSRIWIIQEVFWGGLGRKVQEIRVRYGTKEVWWVNLVVAAARIQAHIDDQRQYFPTVEMILRLEELRNQGEFITKNAMNETMIMDLVATHRNFQATDPRDKVFALIGMGFDEGRMPYKRIRIDYSMGTEEVYVDFAVLALESGPGIELLCHCRSQSMKMLPSWVPDWSTSASEKPLPGRILAFYKIKPWWLNQYTEKHEGEESGSPTFTVVGPGKGLQINNGPPDEIKMNTITKNFADACSPESLGILKELIDSGRLISVSTNVVREDEILRSRTEEESEASERRGERITQRNAESKNKARFTGPVVNYAAAGETRSKIAIDRTTNTLELEGILFDVIDQIYEAFVDDVNAEWENSTHFMVVVGQCKKAVLLDYMGPNPYGSQEVREKAFWLTTFAGRTTYDSGEEIRVDKMPFHEWLPLVPTTWISTSPQVTAVYTGRIEVADVSKAWELALNGPNNLNKGVYEIEMPGVGMQSNLQPEEWTDEDCKRITNKFQQLACLWHLQPFDLYHRPFSLPTVVPDPFWEIRQMEDKVALLRSKSSKYEDMLAYEDFTGPDGKRWNPRQKLEEVLKTVVPIVPKGTLDVGFEEYALGRRLFITRNGYIGLGSMHTKVGDRVAVLMGSNMPFVLRKLERGWQMIGETYVHGIMEGEVIEKWKLGIKEAGKLVLY